MSVESSIVLRIRSEFYLHTSVCLSHLRYSSRNLSHPFKGEEKDSEEEVGITQPLPLTPCLPSLSPMFPQCGQKHGGHGYSQHGLSPLSYQIDLELAQKYIGVVVLYILYLFVYVFASEPIVRTAGVTAAAVNWLLNISQLEPTGP